MLMEKTWFVYLLRCGDGSLYCGVSDDVLRRLGTHRSGKGAKYTRGRGPLELAYTEECESYRVALRREYAIKRMTRAQKLELIRSKATG